MPRRTLRSSQIAQLVLPLAALLGCQRVGWLIALAYLATGGLVPGTPFGLLGRGLAVSTAVLAVATAAGSLVSVPKDVTTHLRSE